MNSLLEEWRLYHHPGDNEQQILARMLGNHLLSEHGYEEKNKVEKEKIKRNILWVWGILDTYPGVFPSVFFQSALDDEQFRESLKIDKELTEKTLRYMKNAGLCEESCDEQKSILLRNMVLCVKKYFFEIPDTSKVDTSLDSQKKDGPDEKKGKFSDLYGDFENELALSEEKYSGLECFRGYTMDNYDGELRAYVLREYVQMDTQNDHAVEDILKQDDPAEDILELLGCLGKQVEDDNGRKVHKDLNLVLHYEIKLVIRFLINCLSELKNVNEKDIGIVEEKKKKIANIGYRFAHYFHYIPNYAYPLAKKLLQIMNEQNSHELYEMANMNRVMGDIQRLLGKKTDAAHSYEQALEFCDSQMLKIFSMNKQDDDFQEISKRCRRIRAGALLISNDYESLKRMKMDEKDDPEQIYENIGDIWGQAYYNQRMGEMLFDDNEEPEMRNNDKKNSDPCLEKQEATIETIIGHYNKASELYMKTGSKTGTAYILKCMGDLIEKFRLKYIDYELEEVRGGEHNDIYYKIIKKNGGQNQQWAEQAAKCYRQAFIYYYGHINWRGFANVIQAMGTTYRISYGNEIDRAQMKNISKLYGFAEECYRWLGDVRGLADTLDYFGYGYRECKDKNDNEFLHMALSKWMESREMWKDQGNDLKADSINKAIQGLRNDLKSDKR